MSDIPGSWFHCSRCGALFRASSLPEQRGPCTTCGGDPVAAPHTIDESGQVLIRRKVRKRRKNPRPEKQRRGSRKKARALVRLVIIWVLLLCFYAAGVHFIGPQRSRELSGDREGKLNEQSRDDARLIQLAINDCHKRLADFLAANDIAGRSPHVFDPQRVIPEMARAEIYDPIFSSKEPLTLDFHQVVHTPAGPVIQTMWRQEGGGLIEAVFIKDANGEWKIDWHAFTHAGSTSWSNFLIEEGDSEGTFRLLARERVGATGRDPDYIALVLYAPRFGNPSGMENPSPEIRVARNSLFGQRILGAFGDRTRGIGRFGNRVLTYDPEDMIRLHVRIARKSGREASFDILELIATDWMELPKTEPSDP